MQGHVFPSTDPHAELQAVEAIETADPLTIDRPALPPQKHPDPLIPEPRSGMRQIPNAYSQGGLILRPALPIPGGPTELGQTTGPRATHLKRPMKPLSQFPAAGGP